MAGKGAEWERISPKNPRPGLVLCHRVTSDGQETVAELTVGKIDVVVKGVVERQTTGFKVLVNGQDHTDLGSTLTRYQAEKRYLKVLKEVGRPKRKPRKPKVKRPVQSRLVFDMDEATAAAPRRRRPVQTPPPPSPTLSEEGKIQQLTLPLSS